MKDKLIFLVIVLFSGFLLSSNINKPFIGQHDWNGVVYGQQAKNFVRYGYLPLKFGATSDVGIHPVEELNFTTHYTPVLPILISLSYRVFGISERSTRLVALIASVLTVGLIISLGKIIFNLPTGLLAGVLTGITPMFIYYGKNPVHEVVQLPFILMSFLSYCFWFKSKKNIWWYGLIFSIVPAMMIGWPGYYALGLITLHGILYSQHKRRFYFLPIVALCLFVFFLWHINLIRPESISDLVQVAKNRVGYNRFPLSDYTFHEIRFMINLFSATVLVFSGLWSLSFLCKIFASKTVKLNQIPTPRPACISYAEGIAGRQAGLGMTSETSSVFPSRSLLFFIGIFGVSHIFIFQNAGWYHEYLLFPLLPFLAISSANFIVNLSHKIPFRIIRQIFPLLILLFVAFERIDYAKALLTSEYVEIVYKDALQVSRRLEIGEELTYSKDGWVYFVFYADRL